MIESGSSERTGEMARGHGDCATMTKHQREKLNTGKGLCPWSCGPIALNLSTVHHGREEVSTLGKLD